MSRIATSGKSKSESITPEQEKKSIDIETIVETNVATCYLKLENPRKALEHSDLAISLSSDYYKAYIRRAEARVQLRNYDEAMNDFNTALSHTHDETWIKKINSQKRELSSLIKKEENKQKKAFAGIFERANNENA